MSDDFFSRKMAWHEAAMCDPRLPPLTHRIVGLLIAPRYLNASLEKAWPSIAHLAEWLKAHPRNIQRALDRLVEGGWLARKVATRGRGHNNEYRMPEGKYGASAVYNDDGKYGASAVYTERKIRRVRRPIEEEKKAEGKKPASQAACRVRGGPSFDGPGSGPAAKRGVPARSSKQALLDPAEWIMTPADLEAAAETAGWDATRAQAEFEGTGGRKGFKTFYADPDYPRRTKNIRTPADVAERWRKWCSDGRRMDDEREAEQSARGQNGSGSRRGNADKIDRTVRGVMGWYKQQQAAAQEAENE